MKQLLFRIGTNAAACMVLLVISIISFNCIESPSKLVGPTYDTQLSIPVLDKTEYFGDFTKKDTVFKFNSTDSTYYYNTTFTTEPIPIDTISIQPESNDTLLVLGVFDINAFSLPIKNISASDFGIPIGSLPGLPAGTFSAGSIQFADTSQFDYVGINSGILTMTITNNLPVPIDFPDPIILRNNWSSPNDTIRVASFKVTGILNQGGSISILSPLNNNLLRGILTTDAVMLHTAGSASPITISTSNGISLSFQSTPLKVDSALAVIPNQTISPIANEFTLDDSTVIKDAFFKAGRFSIVLINNFKVTTQVHLHVNELISNVTQNSFTADATIHGGESYTYPISMVTYHISTTPGTELGTHLHYSVLINVLDSQGEKKAVSKNDFVQAELRPDQPLIAQSINGRFKPRPQSINSGFKSEFDLGKDINKVKAELLFKNVKLHLRLMMPGNGIPFSYENLELIAKNSKHNQTRSIIISNGIIDPSQPNSFIDISQEPNIANFTNFFGEFFPDLPDSFFVRGGLTVSPLSVFQTGIFYNIYDTSRVYPAFDLSIPTDLAIVNGSLTDVEKNSIKYDVDKSITRSIIDGTMNLEFTNRISIELKFQMNYLKWDSAVAHSDTLFRISPDSLVKASAVDVNGVSTNSKTTNIAVVLTSAQVDMMRQADSVYIQLYFNTGNGQNPVKFKKDDYIHIRSSINARCTVNKP